MIRRDVIPHLSSMTVQIEIEEPLISEIDQVVKTLRIDRDAYFRKLAVEDLISRQYAEAYGRQPMTEEELEWLDIQHWEVE